MESGRGRRTSAATTGLSDSVDCDVLCHERQDLARWVGIELSQPLRGGAFETSGTSGNILRTANDLEEAGHEFESSQAHCISPSNKLLQGEV
jgi:hypothetical protein